MGKPMKIVVGSLAVGVAAVGLFLYSRNASAKQEGLKTVDITRGTIIDKALAVGQIVPDQEIQVKSQISGIIDECFVEVGDRVEIGQPLFSVSPDPTPLELADAERRVQLSQVAYDRAAAGPRAHEVAVERRHPGARRLRRPAEGLRAGAHHARAGEGQARAPQGRADRAQDQRRRLGDPGLGRRHGARAQGQSGRSGGAAHLVPGGHGADDPGGHERRSSSRARSTRSTSASSTRGWRSASRSAPCRAAR